MKEHCLPYPCIISHALSSTAKDDGQLESSLTPANMIAAFRKQVSPFENGKCIFFHDSGHGGILAEGSNDDETLVSIGYCSITQLV